MKQLKPILLLLAITLVATLLKRLIPLPIPSSIYGIGLLFGLLCTGVLKLSAIERTAELLLELMPLFFVPAGVGLLIVLPDLMPVLLPILVIVFLSTFWVMGVTGKVAEWRLLRLDGKTKRAPSSDGLLQEEGGLELASEGFTASSVSTETPKQVTSDGKEG